MSNSSELQNLEKAQKIQQLLANAKLNIVSAQKEFDERTSITDDDLKLPLAFEDNGGLIDPASISLDVAAQLVLRHSLFIFYPRSSHLFFRPFFAS